jgi:hypothetical protein
VRKKKPSVMWKRQREVMIVLPDISAMIGSVGGGGAGAASGWLHRTLSGWYRFVRGVLRTEGQIVVTLGDGLGSFYFFEREPGRPESKSSWSRGEGA